MTKQISTHVTQQGATQQAETALCRALSHPLRRSLLRGLLGGECDVGVMQEKTQTDQPTVSKHLAVLRESGVVEVRVDGRRRCYTLTYPEQTGQLLKALDELAANLS